MRTDVRHGLNTRAHGLRGHAPVLLRVPTLALALTIAGTVAAAQAPPSGTATASDPAAHSTRQQNAQPTPLDRLLHDGYAAYDKGDYRASRDLLQKGLQRAEALRDNRRIASFLRSLGGVQGTLGDYDGALRSLNSSLAIRLRVGTPAEVASTLNGRGTVYEDLGRLKAALAAFHQAFLIYKRLRYEADIAEELNNLGTAYDSLDRPQLAIDCYNRALKIDRKLHRERDIGETLDNLGAAYYGLRQTQVAFGYFTQALAIAKTVGSKEDISEALHNLGTFYTGAHQPQAALGYFDQELVSCRQIGNDLKTADGLNGLGSAYNGAGEFQRAIDCFREALGLYEKVGNDLRTAAALNNVGGECYKLGRYPDAIEYLKDALALDRKVGNERGAAEVLDNLGAATSAHGQFQDALIYHAQVLEAFHTVKDDEDTARELFNTGEVYDRLGQFDAATLYFKRARARYQAMADDTGTAACLNGLGAASYGLWQLSAAACYLRQALEIRLRIADDQAVAATRNDLGAVYLSTGNIQRARREFNQALAIDQRIGNDENAADVLNNLGTLSLRVGQLRQAMDYFSSAAALNAKGGNDQEIAQNLANVAAACVRMGQLDRAEVNFADACRHFESAERQIGDAAQVGAFQQTAPHLYAAYASERVQKHLPYDAVVLADSGRARGLARQSAESTTSLSGIFTPVDARRWAEAQEEEATATGLLAASRQRIEAGSLFMGGQERRLAQTQLAAIQERADQALGSLQILRGELYGRYQRFREIKGAQPITADQLKQLAAQNPDTLYLHYDIVDEDSTLLFALSAKDSLHAITLPAGDRELAALAARWRSALTAVPRIDSPDTPLSQAPALRSRILQEPHDARALFNILLLPLQKAGVLLPGRYKHLVIVADGPLLDIPFAALIDPHGHRLIDHFALSTTASLGFLVWPQEERPATGSLFFAADPTGAKGEKLANKSSILRLLGGRFNSLPGARLAAEQIAGLFPGSFGLAGPRARKRDVMQQMGRCALLLFATHGWLDEANGLQSWLLLAPDKGADQDEGLLHAHEILTLPLAARLAVLMACQSGLGQVSGGEGLEGLVWAFWAAGCPAVVASEWEVEQEATSRLMVAFCRNLRAGQRKDDALRTAMLALRKQKAWQSPYYWAPVAVYGDTTPLPAQLTGGAVPVSMRQ